MTEEIQLTRRQLGYHGANDEWFKAHMPGRGRLPLSKVVKFAPRFFSVRSFDPCFTGEVRWVTGLVVHFKRGEIHNEEGPAYIHPDGFQFWYLHGEFYRSQQNWKLALAELHHEK